MATELPRLSITLSPKSYELLQKLSEVHKCSKSKVLDRMLLQSLQIASLLSRWDNDLSDIGGQDAEHLS